MNPPESVPPGGKPVPVKVPRDRRVVPDTRLRDTLIAVAAGLAVLAFVGWAVVSLSRTASSSGGVEGVIASKEFVSQPETQVTVGKSGVTSRQVAGVYILHVRVPKEGREYRVYVSENDFRTHSEGERYYFIRPKEDSPAPAPH